MKYKFTLFLQRNRNIAALLLGLICQTIQAQIPAGYYDAAEGKKGAELKTALHNIIKVGQRLGYGSGNGKTWSGFELADKHPDGSVWDMYSNNKRYFNGNAGAVSGMNIEHSVAKSWWGGSNNDAYKDIYHLNPSDIAANSARSNYPLGINNGSKFNNGAIKVGNNTFGNEYNGLCFEPKDEYKGDFARAYLYMFTCYQDYSWTGTNAPNFVKSGETYPMLRTWSKDLLLDWCRKDPVSEKERNRAEAIYSFQKNRNPFIDHPELVEYLWGNKIGASFTTNQTTPTVTQPMNGTTIHLPKTHYTTPSTYELRVEALRLTGDLKLELSGSMANRFELSISTIKKANAMAGTSVAITYRPTKAETATAQLTIKGGGLENPVTVELSALATDSFTALEASNITSTGFTANWTSSSTATNYEVNLFEMVTDKNGGEETIASSSFDQLPEGWQTKGFTELKDGEIKLGSGKNDGAITSPELDLSAPSTITLKAKKHGSDALPMIYIWVDGVQVATITTEKDYKTFTIQLAEATQESIIEIWAVKNKRVYITDMTIVTGVEKSEMVQQPGFPKLAGLNTSLNIEGLKPGTTYYYSVKTIGDQSVESSPVEVITLSSTSVEKNVMDEIRATSVQGNIHLFNLPQGCNVIIRDLSGLQLAEQKNSGSYASIAIEARGVVLVSIAHQKQNKTVKVVMK